MPKETIMNQSQIGDDQLFRFEILWNKDKYCQVATVKETNDPNKAADGGVEGYYVNLDREGLNKAIRVLRRARDQAYGKDE